MSHPRTPHGCFVILCFVIAARLRYQRECKRARLKTARKNSQSGRVHPPTNVSGPLRRSRFAGGAVVFREAISAGRPA